MISDSTIFRTIIVWGTEYSTSTRKLRDYWIIAIISELTEVEVKVVPYHFYPETAAKLAYMIAVLLYIVYTILDSCKALSMHGGAKILPWFVMSRLRRVWDILGEMDGKEPFHVSSTSASVLYRAPYKTRRAAYLCKYCMATHQWIKLLQIVFVFNKKPEWMVGGTSNCTAPSVESTLRDTFALDSYKWRRKKLTYAHAHEPVAAFSTPLASSVRWANSPGCTERCG